jgi:hypothetical protein
MQEKTDMKEFIDKLSSYNIFNYLLPGLLFAVFAEYLTSYKLIQNDLVVTLFLCYFIGLCVSRLGSLILEPALKSLSFLQFAPYEDFLRCAKDDPKIGTLSEVNNMYRTLCSLFLALSILMLFEFVSEKIGLSSRVSAIVLCILLGVLFAWSYRKQTQYITKRIKGAQK